mgnify:CR=1 FL=1
MKILITEDQIKLVASHLCMTHGMFMEDDAQELAEKYVITVINGLTMLAAQAPELSGLNEQKKI